MATAVKRMRKFLNDPEQLVKEALAGLEAAHPTCSATTARRRSW